MDNAQVAAIARELGHTRVTIRETVSGRRWIVECTCGWGAPQSGGNPSITRATFNEAVRTGQWHIRSSVQKWLAENRRNGRVSRIEALGVR